MIHLATVAHDYLEREVSYEPVSHWLSVLNALIVAVARTRASQISPVVPAVSAAVAPVAVVSAAVRAGAAVSAVPVASVKKQEKVTRLLELHGKIDPMPLMPSGVSRHSLMNRFSLHDVPNSPRPQYERKTFNVDPDLKFADNEYELVQYCLVENRIVPVYASALSNDCLRVILSSEKIVLNDNRYEIHGLTNIDDNNNINETTNILRS